jgi:hypothetical protein
MPYFYFFDEMTDGRKRQEQFNFLFIGQRLIREREKER